MRRTKNGARLHMHLGKEDMDLLDDLAKRSSMTRSETVRHLIRGAAGRIFKAQLIKETSSGN